MRPKDMKKINLIFKSLAYTKNRKQTLKTLYTSGDPDFKDYVFLFGLVIYNDLYNELGLNREIFHNHVMEALSDAIGDKALTVLDQTKISASLGINFKTCGLYHAMRERGYLPSSTSHYSDRSFKNKNYFNSLYVNDIVRKERLPDDKFIIPTSPERLESIIFNTKKYDPKYIFAVLKIIINRSNSFYMQRLAFYYIITLFPKTTISCLGQINDGTRGMIMQYMRNLISEEKLKAVHISSFSYHLGISLDAVNAFTRDWILSLEFRKYIYKIIRETPKELLSDILLLIYNKYKFFKEKSFILMIMMYLFPRNKFFKHEELQPLVLQDIKYITSKKALEKLKDYVNNDVKNIILDGSQYTLPIVRVLLTKLKRDGKIITNNSKKQKRDKKRMKDAKHIKKYQTVTITRR